MKKLLTGLLLGILLVIVYMPAVSSAEYSRGETGMEVLPLQAPGTPVRIVQGLTPQQVVERFYTSVEQNNEEAFLSTLSPSLRESIRTNSESAGQLGEIRSAMEFSRETGASFNFADRNIRVTSVEGNRATVEFRGTVTYRYPELTDEVTRACDIFTLECINNQWLITSYRSSAQAI